MKRILTTAFSVVLFTLVAFGSQPITMASYNIRNGVGLDNRRDVERTANVVRRLYMDFVALQEVDSMTNRSGGTDVAAEIAKRAGMYHTYAKAIDYDGGAYGVALLSREEPLSVKRVALPGREEARVLLIADFGNVAVACTHLSLTATDREASARIIVEEARMAGKPMLLAGDFNSRPDEETMKILSEEFQLLTNTDEMTYPAGIPYEVLDYIMVSGAGKVEMSVSVVANEPLASDHRPVVVDMELP